jgi:large subunit ribosomal protein L24
MEFKKTKMFIRKDDQVVVLSGRSKSSQGKVLRVDSKNNRVLVEGLNMVKRHTKPSQTSPQGGIVEKEAWIHYSSVSLLDPKTKKPVRASKLTRNQKGELQAKA